MYFLSKEKQIRKTAKKTKKNPPLLRGGGFSLGEGGLSQVMCDLT